MKKSSKNFAFGKISLQQYLLDVTKPRHKLLTRDGLAILVLVALTYQPGANNVLLLEFERVR